MIELLIAFLLGRLDGCKDETQSLSSQRSSKTIKKRGYLEPIMRNLLGKCKVVKAVPALYASEISKEEFQEAMAIKKRSLKATKAYLKDLKTIPFEEQCENYKVA